MTITFSEVPSALRYPGAYIEIDGSQAGLSSDLPVVLLVGQKLASGTAPTGELVRVASVADAKTLAGDGSMLAQMAARYRNVDQTFDLYMLPYADNAAGVAATGSINVNSAATGDGTLALYIAQRAITVGVAAGKTAAQIATAIAQAITDAGADIPVTAVAAGAAVTLSARHKGTCGNAIDLRLNLYGEDMPAGLALALTAMAGGTGDPLPGDLATLIGQKWFRYVVLGINDAATLAAWHAESQRRYRVPVQAGFRAFAAYRGDYAAAASFGETKNYEHITDLSLGINPPTTWEAAATLAAAAAPKLYNNPVISLEGTSLPGLVATSYHEWTSGNSLLFKGMSLMEVGTDGSCYIKRLISMYLHRSDGSTDDAYLDINVAEVTERIRYEQRTGAIKKFRGTVAAKTDEGYRPGLPITTEDGVKAFLLSLYKNVLMSRYGWVQAYDYYKSTLVVEQDPDNPSRFNFLDDPVVNSPFYILAGRSRFRKAVPVV
ncbi:phage tail sheath protein [Ralstonia solanacearum]|uniref:phage tail sheath protein n=1 Tax=Ralstonia solanacearum TaxID=305 RepID=UPI0005075F22|nr:phage tail sheath protein [Ralstonia solanacearum]KFX30688.1 tail sheath protein (gpL) from Mu-like prophage FluMu [Ralstonia solanacearum]